MVTADEPTIVPKPLFDAIVMEDGQGDRSLSNPPGTDESNWSEVFRETNHLLDQLKTVPASAFEAVDVSGCMVDVDSGKADCPA